MLKNFLKSGFMPFLAGLAVILIYFWISPFKVVPHGGGMPTAFNLIFTLLFMSGGCLAAFKYGRNKNKSGLIGLLCIFALYLIIVLLAMSGLNFSVLPIAVQMPLLYLFFAYATLFMPFWDANAIFYIPVSMIFLIILSWQLGNRKKRKGDHNVSTN